MKITDGDKTKHRKLQNEGDLQKISAGIRTHMPLRTTAFRVI
ncbi:hypothetical protein [Acetobacterium sp. UBA5834]|nr:hypothetical protein [Acetobacterium sp. UBA5834]